MTMSSRYFLLWLIALMLGCCVVVPAQREYSLTLYCNGKPTSGFIYQAGEKCHFQWQIFDQAGRNLSPSEREKTLKGYALSISQKNGKLLRLADLPAKSTQFSWQVPVFQKRQIVLVTLNALLQNRQQRVTSEMKLYVSPKKKPQLAIDNREKALKILMDWHGKRGFYQKHSPTEALQAAKAACHFLRQKVDPIYFQDYLSVMEKTEQTKIAPLDIYCPEKKAQLLIDGQLVGFFEQWSEQYKMYRLSVPLPVNKENAYSILVRTKNKSYRTAHTHTGQSPCVIKKLYSFVAIEIHTPEQPSRIRLGSRYSKNWKNRHRFRVYQNRYQNIIVEMKGGEKLRIYLHPTASESLQIVTENGNFYLYQNGQKHIFSGRELNLVDF